MELIKYVWAVRALVYRVFFKKIGNFCYIGKPVIISGAKNIVLENKVRIYPGIRLETYGGGKIHIEENTSIAQNVHITSAGDELRIGKNCTILGNSFITNIDHNYKKVGEHILDQCMDIHQTTIGENCFIGYGASIQAGTVLGKQCIVGANAVVRGSYPDYCVIAGVPARIIRQYNHKTKQWDRVYSSPR